MAFYLQRESRRRPLNIDSTNLWCRVPVLFFILLLWVFEVQLLMQIIINRIAIIHERPQTIRWIKWGTFVGILIVEILVFCIWIPAHMDPPVSQL